MTAAEAANGEVVVAAAEAASGEVLVAAAEAVNGEVELQGEQSELLEHPESE